MKKEVGNICLAPMDEINDIAFRIICKKAGADRTYTPMTPPKLDQKLFLDDKPILQVICSNERGVADFMKRYDSQVLGWDLNLSCPGKIAREGGFGAFLTDKKVIDNILSTMRSHTKKILSVKLRKTEHTVEISKIARKYCDEIVIHPRTIKQGYLDKPDLRFAKSIKKVTNIPVIYSGDITEENYLRFLKEFDGIMIGRGAIGNPNIFSRIKNKKIKVNFLDYLKIAKKYNLPLKQIKFQAINFNNRIPGGERYILKILKAKNYKRLNVIFDWIYKNLIRESGEAYDL